ncbi:SAM-dependent methyltransferase [Candidatus Woesebacteria bacterium]|nr:MAG: SAM-dependent methyltransferase [Candidatus Woesebacteria bacterium]
MKRDFFYGNNAPYVPSDADVVERVMEMAEVKKGDVVYDLGAGDGRFVLAAAMKGASAVGVELNLLRSIYARVWFRILRIDKTAKIIRQDIFKTDLSKATVVICYLLQETNDALQKKLEKELKPGTKVISIAFKFAGWKEVKFDGRGVVYGPIRMYEIE